MTDLTIKLCSTWIFHSNFVTFNQTKVLMSGLRFLGSDECKLSNQSWTKKKLIWCSTLSAGVIIINKLVKKKFNSCKTWNSKLMVGWNS